MIFLLQPSLLLGAKSNEAMSLWEGSAQNYDSTFTKLLPNVRAAS